MRETLRPDNLALQLAGHGVVTGVYEQNSLGGVSFVGLTDNGGEGASAAASPRRFFFCAACVTLGEPGDIASHQRSRAHLDCCRASLDGFITTFLPLETLPLAVLQRIFSDVPVDVRLRCIEVSRAWRALLADTSFWTRLDASISSGCARFTVQLFRAAVTKAGGQLRFLDLTGRDGLPLNPETVCNKVAENATYLTELRVPGICFDEQLLTAMVVPATRLTHFSCQASIHSFNTSLAMLRNQPPFASVRLTRLFVRQWHETSGWPEFASALAGHTYLQQLELCHVHNLNSAVAMEALVDAAISVRLSALTLMYCGCTPATVPALTRLVAHGSLHKLEITNHGDVTLFEGGNTRLFCDAARKSYDDGVLSVLVLIGTGDNEERDVFHVGRHVMGADYVGRELPVDEIIILDEDSDDDAM